MYNLETMDSFTTARNLLNASINPDMFINKYIFGYYRMKPFCRVKILIIFVNKKIPYSKVNKKCQMLMVRVSM